GKKPVWDREDEDSESAGQGQMGEGDKLILPTNPMPETEEEKETKRMERIMAANAFFFFLPSVSIAINPSGQPIPNLRRLTPSASPSIQAANPYATSDALRKPKDEEPAAKNQKTANVANKASGSKSNVKATSPMVFTGQLLATSSRVESGSIKMEEGLDEDAGVEKKRKHGMIDGMMKNSDYKIRSLLASQTNHSQPATFTPPCACVGFFFSGLGWPFEEALPGYDPIKLPAYDLDAVNEASQSPAAEDDEDDDSPQSTIVATSAANEYEYHGQ
ncbi:MAG: hypothetical protein L6R42_010175, partial [Xanthoria sp. 1 TBL-2021]